MFFILSAGGVNSIVSFSIFVPSASDPSELRFLNADECKRFYTLMTTPIDASKFSDDSDLLFFLKQSVLLGQPVKLANSGLSVLRIALGADIVVNSLEKLFSFNDVGVLVPSFPGLNAQTVHAACKSVLADDRAVVKKAFYLAKYWNILTSASSSDSSSSSPLLKRLRLLDDSLLSAPNPNQSVATSLGAVAEVAQQLSQTNGLPPGV